MTTLAARMPKKEGTISVQAHLSQEAYRELKALADAKQWSIKKMNENIILEYLAAQKKAKKP